MFDFKTASFLRPVIKFDTGTCKSKKYVNVWAQFVEEAFYSLLNKKYVYIQDGHVSNYIQDVVEMHNNAIDVINRLLKTKLKTPPSKVTLLELMVILSAAPDTSHRFELRKFLKQDMEAVPRKLRNQIPDSIKVTLYYHFQRNKPF